MEFECMKKTVGYEALVSSLQKAITLNIVVIKVVGDLDILVHQVRNTI